MTLDVFDAARRAGGPDGEPVGDPLLFAIRRAQASYLRTAIGRTDLPSTDEELQGLRSHAAFLDLKAEDAGADVASDAWYVAGTIYEWLSRLDPIPARYASAPSLTRGPAGDLVRASLAYSSGIHEGSSAVAAERALQAMLRLDGLTAYERAIAGTIMSLLSRRLPECLRHAVAYGSAVREAVTGELADVDPGPTMGVLGRIAEASAAQAAAMLSGSESLFESARIRFEEARRLAAFAADDVHALADRIERVADQMTARSTHRVLVRAGLPRQLARRFAAARPELWTNQVEAIEAGFLEPERAFVLALPTGSGKTFMAQLRILATLDRWPEGWVAYVAPSRALVREVFTDMAAALRPHGIRVQRAVAGAEAAVVLDADEVAAVTTGRTCAILTPERLDLYLRADRRLAESLRLVIIDEAHHIGDPQRGATLETTIAMLRVNAPHAKPVLMSAFMSNIDEARRWLGEDASSHSSPVRPSRQLRGILLRYGEQELSDTWVVGTGAATREEAEPVPGWRTHRRVRRTYAVGALVAMDGRIPRSTPDAPRAYAIPAIAAAHSWQERSRPSVRRARPPWRHVGSTAADIAVDVAAAFSAHPGMVLVFFPQVAQAQAAADRIAQRLEPRPDLEPFAEAIERVAGRDALLARLIRRGCAYHHSGMPDEMARVVESAANADLDVLCATSGLQAGINLPASIVIAVGEWRPGAPARPSPRDFANMAGRAGRPGRETEGLALYLPPSLSWRDPMETAGPFLAPRDRDVALVSALSAHLEDIAENDAPMVFSELPEPVQQALLALWAADMRDPESVEAFLVHTLDGDQVPRQLAGELAAAVTAEAAVRGPRFDVFARTSLPFSAFDAMVDLVPELAQLSEDGAWVGSARRQAESITGLLMRVPWFEDFVRRAAGPGVSADDVSETVGAWVGGADYATLGGILGIIDGRTGRVVKAVDGIASAMAWGSGALLRLTAQEGVAPGAEPLLPYLIRFGVDDPVAAYLRLLGVSDRAGAAAIATLYARETAPSFAAVDEWSQSQEGRAAVREHYAENEVARGATERDLGLEERVRPDPRFFGLTGDHPEWLAPGAIVELRPTGEGAWEARDPITGVTWVVDGVPGAGVAAVSSNADGRLRGVVFVA